LASAYDRIAKRREIGAAERDAKKFDDASFRRKFAGGSSWIANCGHNGDESRYLLFFTSVMKALLCAFLVVLLVAAAHAACPSAAYVDPDAVDQVPPSPAVTATTPSFLVTRPSELATTFYPVGPDANPRTNCPWKESGLKNWHDSTTWPNGAVPAVPLYSFATSVDPMKMTLIWNSFNPPCVAISLLSSPENSQHHFELRVHFVVELTWPP